MLSGEGPLASHMLVTCLAVRGHLLLTRYHYFVFGDYCVPQVDLSPPTQLTPVTICLHAAEGQPGGIPLFPLSKKHFRHFLGTELGVDTDFGTPENVDQ